MKTRLFVWAVLILAVATTRIQAASIEWFFYPSFSAVDEFNVLAAIYGDDNRGLAGYRIRLDGLSGMGIDPSTVTFAPNSLWDSLLDVTVDEDSYSASSSQLFVQNLDLGKDATIDLGVLTVPGASSASFYPNNFDDTTATLFNETAGDPPPMSDLRDLTLTDNQVSEAHHGGFVVVDYVIRSVPEFGDVIDFGEVSLGESVLTDIVALINHGFGGEFLDVTGFEFIGDDSSSFDVPGFTPATLQAGVDVATYDLSFSPDAPGEYEATLRMYYVSEFSEPGFQEYVQFSVIGTAVPEPPSVASAISLIVGSLVFWRRSGK